MTTPRPEQDLLRQFQTEYRLAYDYMNPKRIETLSRYRLYSNQKKDKELVSDTLGFTVFNTIHSKLYDDKLAAEFSPGHPDDTDKVDMLNPVAVYDYYKMDKDQIDFDWDWYSGFWGSGFLDVSEYDITKKIMRPSVVNNATLLIDPAGSLVNGDQRGFGAFRFWGREIAKTKDQMKKAGYENFADIQPSSDFSSLQYVDKQYRNQAQGTQTPPAPVNYENDLIPLLEWWTHVNGEKWMFVTDLRFTTIVKAKKLWSTKWPLVQRKLFPIPGDPLGVSIFDLIEDKQRARSVLTNLGLMMAKSDLYPMFVYDRNVISPTTDLSFGLNKWIPADGNPHEGVVPLQKQAVGQIVSYVMDLLDQGAQKATAATNMQQGVQSEAPRSANEMVRVFNQAEDRISTTAKVFGWSERDFWSWWLTNNQHYLTSLHEKIVRIDGAFGPHFETLTGKDFELEDDPDIIITSKVLNDAQNQDAKNDAIAYTNLIAQDQSANHRYWNKRTAKLFGLKTEEVNRLFPPTPDELQAEQENIQLDKNQLPKINIHDDHQTHLLIHAKADDTKAAIVHIEAHKKAILLQREQQQALQPQMQPGAQPQSVQTTPNQNGQGSAPAAQAPNSFSVQK